MERADINFQIGYSICLEKMQATLFSRLDKILQSCLIILGCILILKFHTTIIGLAIIFIVSIQCIYQPALWSAISIIQKQKYEHLQICEIDFDDRELYEQYLSIQREDSLIIGSLAHPAYLYECIRLNRPSNIKLTLWEKVISWFAGNLPQSLNS